MKFNPSRPGRNNAARLATEGRPEFPRATCRHGRSSKTHGKANAVASAPSDIFETAEPRRRGCRMSRRTLALADVKLRQIEDALLDMLLDAHPRQATALDRLLDDVNRADAPDADAAARAALPTPDADVATASVRRIESALLAAVVDNHPRRDRALDRLLGDLDLTPCAVGPEAAHGAWVDEERERAEFDMLCDNDFDGLA